LVQGFWGSQGSDMSLALNSCRWHGWKSRHGAWRFNLLDQATSVLRGILLALFGGILCGQALAAEMLIEFSLADDGALLVSYTPPAGVRELPRWDRSAVARDFWATQVQPRDACTSLGEDHIRLSEGAHCKSARLRVTPKLLARNASYEAAQPISGTGVLAYSGFYAVTLAGFDLHWRWLAPETGYVLQDGRVHRRQADLLVGSNMVSAAVSAGSDDPNSWSQIGARHYAYLGKAHLMEFPGGTLVRDPALDEARVDLILRTLVRTMADLSQAYGASPVGPVGVVTSTADLSNFHGDVSEGRMMRLRLVPAEKEQDPKGQGLQSFVMHETAHWWNMGVRRSDSDRPWMHEGHADWLVLLMQSQHGDWSADTLKAMAASAINRCLLARGELPAAALAPGYSRQDDPYACGFSLMLMAQAQTHARRDPTDSRTPLALLAGLHPKLGLLDMNGFASWADGGTKGPMHGLLFNPVQPFSSGLSQVLQTLQIAEAVPVSESGFQARAKIAGRMMMALMETDCGSFGFTSNSAAGGFFSLDREGPVCASLRRGQDVQTLENVPMLADPVSAWGAMKKACESGRHLTVGYREGGGSSLPCPRAMPAEPPRHLLRLQAGALQRLGLSS